jgi:hypothetical protein
VDRAGATESTGRELMDKGLTIVVSRQPGAAIVTYERIQ